MGFGFRTLAVLCSVAVSFNTGCARRIPAAEDSSGIKSPFYTAGESEDSTADIPSVAVISPEDSIPVEKADCSVVFGKDGTRINGRGAAIKGDQVIIQRDGVYSLSGEAANGKISVTAENVSLILDGLSLYSSENAAIEYSGGGRLMLTLAAGSENSVKCQNTAFLCHGDLTVNGLGAVYFDGDSGISADGIIKLCGGDITISSVENGISSGEYVLASAGNTEIYSGGDGIRVTGSAEDNGYFSLQSGKLSVTSSADGIQTDNGIFISGGEIRLTCGGSSSAVMYVETEGSVYGRHGGYFTDASEAFDFSNLVSGDGSKAGSKKGLRTGGAVVINGGIVWVDSADDCIHSGSYADILSGEVTLRSGDDGIHCDGRVTVSGGVIDVAGSYNAIEGMSVDIDGGEILLSSFRDGINAAGGNDISYTGSADSAERYISISGGDINIRSGGDGIDSGGTAAMSGGKVTISSSDNDGFGSLYYSNSFVLSGGVLAAFGSDGMTKAPSIVSGPCISVFLNAEKGDTVSLSDEKGAVLLSYVLPEDCSSFIFSSENIAEGEVYVISVNGAEVQRVTAADGLCGGGPDSSSNTQFDDVIGDAEGSSAGMVA